MTCGSATGILQSGNGSLPIPKSGSQSWMLSSSGSMRTAFRASSPMNAFRSSLRTMRRKNRSSRCWRVPFGKKWSWRKANRRMLIVFSPLWRGARISRSSRPASSMSSWRKSSSMRQRPEGQEPDAGDRHLLQGHRSLGNVKSHGINGKKRKRYSRSYTVLSFLTMFSYREQPSRSRLFFYSLLNSVSCRPSLRSSAHWIFHSLAKSSRLLPFRSCTHLVSLVSVMVLGSASRLAIHRIYP